MLLLDDFCGFAAHPDLMDESSLAQLQQAVSTYPFFQAARILLLENIYFLESDGVKPFIDNGALYLPYTNIFPVLLDAADRRKAEYLQKDRTMNLLDSFLGDGDFEVTPAFDAPLASSDYMLALGLEPDSPELSDSAARSATDDILDAFLENGSESIKIDIPAEIVREAEDECTHDRELYTETLADICIKQHRYNEAIEIIRSLSLNFPNKSSYFADKIRFLEKLISVNNKNIK